MWRAITVGCAWLGLSLTQAAEPPASARPAPVLADYYYPSAPGLGMLFVLRWESAQGNKFESWARLGEQAGEFRLEIFEGNTRTLTVTDPQGRLHRLALPVDKVRSPEAELTEVEFLGLMQYARHHATRPPAPVLSREKARALYLRTVMADPREGALTLDLDGGTFPPERRAQWAEAQARARAGSDRPLAVVHRDGRTRLHNYGGRRYLFPEQMLRNLTDADWEELSRVDAIISIQRQYDYLKKVAGPTGTPEKKR